MKAYFSLPLFRFFTLVSRGKHSDRQKLKNDVTRKRTSSFSSHLESKIPSSIIGSSTQVRRVCIRQRAVLAICTTGKIKKLDARKEWLTFSFGCMLMLCQSCCGISTLAVLHLKVVHFTWKLKVALQAATKSTPIS